VVKKLQLNARHALFDNEFIAEISGCSLLTQQNYNGVSSASSISNYRTPSRACSDNTKRFGSVRPPVCLSSLRD